MAAAGTHLCWLCVASLAFLGFLLVSVSEDTIGDSSKDTLQGRLGSAKFLPCLNATIIGNDSIMFVESSGKSNLDGRTSCALESTAKHNPGRTVILWYHGEPFLNSNPFLRVLKKLPNVVLQNIKLEDTFKDTPLEPWYARGIINRSLYPTVHLSDALRLVLLYKYGGAYMDIDIVDLKPLTGLKNCISESHQDMVANGFLFFERQHAFLLRCMQRFSRTYSPVRWAENGPRIIRRVILNTCKRKQVRSVVGRKCEGVTVLPRKLLLPISYHGWRYYVSPRLAGAAWKAHNESYVMHVFGAHSRKIKLREGDGSAYGQAAKLHCPMSFRTAVEHYGVF